MPRNASIAVVIALSIVVGVSRDAAAQLKGHYIPGFTGLQNGTQPPPSITLAVPVFVYPTDTIKNDDGETFANPDINVLFTGVSAVWVTNVKLLGANLGGQAVPATFMKSRIEGNFIDSPGSLAFSDITAQPLWLGWHTTRADFTAGWSFFAPTGKWELGGDDNSGLGMWSHDFQGGTTVRLDSRREWSTSLLATYEIHTDKNDVELKVGDILTLEGGTGRAFYHKVDGTPIPRILNLGVVYYTQFKVTSDEGNGPLVDRFLAGIKDRVFAVGAEANIFLPKPKLLLAARVMPEFGARNRTQGLAMLFTIGWQAKSLLRAPAQP